MKKRVKSILVEEDLHEYLRRQGEKGETFHKIIARLVGFKSRQG